MHSIMYNYLYYGCLLYYLLSCVGVATVLSMSTKSSTIRIAASFLLIFFLAIRLMVPKGLCAASISVALVHSVSVVHAIHCLNLLLITKVDRNNLAIPKRGKCLSQIFAPLPIILSVRGVGTPWQVKNTFRYPLMPISWPIKSNRITFSIRQTAICAWQYLLLDILQAISWSADLDTQEVVYSSATVILSLTSRSTSPLVQVALDSIYMGVLFKVYMDIWYRCASVILVNLRLTSPDDWPALFGSLWDMYCLRDFWGKYWHQWLRWPLTSVSKLFTIKVLGLAPWPVLERYTRLVVIFSMSGALHLVANRCMGLSRSQTSPLLYFLINAAGIMIEDYAKVMWGRKVLSQRKGGPRIAQTACKFWGFIWATCWLSIAAWWFIYPILRFKMHDAWLVPYSVTRTIGLQSTLAIFTSWTLAMKLLFNASL